MHSIKQWIRTPAAWGRPPFAELPCMYDDDDVAVRHWSIVAGGLALILSRAKSGHLSTHLTASLQLHHLLRQQLRQQPFVEASAELLCDVMREIAAIADPMTKASVRACLHARHRQSAPRDADSAARFHAGEAVANDSSAGLLAERSSSLRKAVATARITAFGELK